MSESNDRKVSKETKNKIYWETTVESIDKDGNPVQASFRLYIHKWRVPEPIPPTIYVKIEPAKLQKKPKFLSIDEVLDDPSLRSKPITAIIHAFKQHTETLRYHPIEDHTEWEIGEPYVPYSLTHNQTEYLKITIKWENPSQDSYIAFTNS
jgi:hypothetical protein